eukprot:1158014-Pelagomonas_calceolata.AAC.4
MVTIRGFQIILLASDNLKRPIAPPRDHFSLPKIFCRGLPRVWGQKSGRIPAKMGSPGSSPPACLTNSDGWALYQEHILGGPGGSSGVQKIASDLDFGRENGDLT